MTWAARLGIGVQQDPRKLEVGVVRCVCKCIVALCMHALRLNADYNVVGSSLNNDMKCIV